MDSLITMLGIIYSSNSFMVKVLVYGCHLWILCICTLQSHSKTFCYPLNVLAILMLCHKPNSRRLLFALLVLKIVVKMTFSSNAFFVVEAVHDVYYV